MEQGLRHIARDRCLMPSLFSKEYYLYETECKAMFI